MKQRSLDIINSVSYHQGIIAGCDEMLSVLNPELAQKHRQEQEIADMKKQMADLMEMNRQLMAKLSTPETSASAPSRTKKEQL